MLSNCAIYEDVLTVYRPTGNRRFIVTCPCF